jgi:hypothetical protein
VKSTRSSHGTQPFSFTSDERFAAAGSPAEWARVALELQYSAKVLWSQEHLTIALSNSFDAVPSGKSMVTRSSILLYGFALENILKAIIVANNPTTVSTGQLSRSFKSHNLSDLAQFANFVLDANETALCGTLSEAIPYWGRYPIPTKDSDLSDEKDVSQEMMESLDRLFIKMSDDLTNILSTGWDNGKGVRIVQYERRGNRFSVMYEIEEQIGGTTNNYILMGEIGPP